MRRNQSRLNAVCRLALIVSSLIVTAGVALAQRAPGPPPGKGRPLGDSAKDRLQDQQRREMRLRNVEREGAQAEVNQERLQAAIEVVKHDFKRIQIIRNEMVDDLVAKKPLDYRLISEQAGEISKRAHQLKTYLMPPIPDEKDKKNQVEYTHEEMKGALVKLCNLIYNFTENPVLKTPDVVDVKESARAGRDLLSIIEISDNLKSSAERLSRN